MSRTISEKARVQVTAGMANAMGRGGRISRRCKECKRGIAVYPGRYPTICPMCDGELSTVEENIVEAAPTVQDMKRLAAKAAAVDPVATNRAVVYFLVAREPKGPDEWKQLPAWAWTQQQGWERDDFARELVWILQGDSKADRWRYESVSGCQQLMLSEAMPGDVQAALAGVKPLKNRAAADAIIAAWPKTGRGPKPKANGNEAKAVVQANLRARGWTRDYQASKEVWISGDQRLRCTFKRAVVVYEKGGRGNWQRDYSIMPYGDTLQTIGHAFDLYQRAMALVDPGQIPQKPAPRPRAPRPPSPMSRSMLPDDPVATIDKMRAVLARGDQKDQTMPEPAPTGGRTHAPSTPGQTPRVAKGRFTTQTSAGTKEWDGWIIGSWGVYQNAQAPKDRSWNLVHLNSGLALGAVSAKAKAVWAAKELAKLPYPWATYRTGNDLSSGVGRDGQREMMDILTRAKRYSGRSESLEEAARDWVKYHGDEPDDGAHVIVGSQVPRIQALIEAGTPRRFDPGVAVSYATVAEHTPGGVQGLAWFTERARVGDRRYRCESPLGPVLIFEFDDRAQQVAIYSTDDPADVLGFDPRDEMVEDAGWDRNAGWRRIDEGMSLASLASMYGLSQDVVGAVISKMIRAGVPMPQAYELVTVVLRMLATGAAESVEEAFAVVEAKLKRGVLTLVAGPGAPKPTPRGPVRVKPKKHPGMVRVKPKKPQGMVPIGGGGESVDEERKYGLHTNSDGSGYTALTRSQSKTFKSKTAAVKWLAKRGYKPDGTKERSESVSEQVSRAGPRFTHAEPIRSGVADEERRMSVGAPRRPGKGATRVHGGTRFTIGGHERKPRKDVEASMQARRNAKRGEAKRIQAARAWHQSAEGAKYHEELGRYNTGNHRGEAYSEPLSVAAGRVLSASTIGENFADAYPNNLPPMPADMAQDNPTVDDIFDSIQRRLITIESSDILEDVNFSEDGSIYLFFDPSQTRKEIDEVYRWVQQEHSDLQLVGSPDRSLPGESARADWWVMFLPGKTDEGAGAAPDPAHYARDENGKPGDDEMPKEQMVVKAPPTNIEKMSMSVDPNKLMKGVGESASRRWLNAYKE